MYVIINSIDVNKWITPNCDSDGTVLQKPNEKIIRVHQELRVGSFNFL